MLRLLTTRRWLTWLLVATLWATLCVIAGFWQWGRWEDKSTVQNRIDANYDATPTPMSRELSTSRAPAKSDEWKQVTGRGHYVGEPLLVRNRPGPDGDFGYETLGVFEVDGMKVVVDRGWVANGETAARPASIPQAPKGEVALTGWVRPSEKSLGRAEVNGQVSSISVADVERATGATLAQGYVRMRSEKLADGSTPPRPAALDRPSQGSAAGINLSYALQWWLGAIAGYAFVLLRARREYLDSLELADEAPVAHDTEAGGDSASATGFTETGSTTPVRPTKKPAKKPRPRKQRIWDEEDA